MLTVITGGSSGLGACIKKQLHGDVVDWSWPAVNLQDATHVALAASVVQMDHGKVDVLINCAGVNHLAPICDLAVEDFDAVMAVNARGMFLTAKYLADMMQGGTILNIVSNASHMPMTHSLAYNASKGAAHIMTLQMAHELFPSHGITVFGISPNKLKNTGMTTAVDAQVCLLRGWTQSQAANYQRSKLAIGEETDPEVLADFIGFLLSKKWRHKYLHGCIIPYGH